MVVPYTLHIYYEYLHVPYSLISRHIVLLYMSFSFGTTFDFRGKACLQSQRSRLRTLFRVNLSCYEIFLFRRTPMKHPTFCRCWLPLALSAAIPRQFSYARLFKCAHQIQESHLKRNNIPRTSITGNFSFFAWSNWGDIFSNKILINHWFQYDSI